MKAFKEFIMEAPDIDLKSLYLKFNKLYFNDRLPKDLKIEWGTHKRLGGFVIAQVMMDRKTKKITRFVGFKKMVISRLLKRSDEDIIKILLHEMVHVALHVDGIHRTSGGDKQHGIEFQREKKKIERLSGYDIPDTEDANELELADDIAEKTKVMGVVLYYRKSKWWVILIQHRTFQQEYHRLIRNFEITASNFDKIYIGHGSTHLHHKVTTIRKITPKSVVGRNIPDMDAMKLREKMTVIWKHE